MIELERTFLAKRLPDGLSKCKVKEIFDVYIPKSDRHPKLRIRKNGDRYEMTKKRPVIEGDASRSEEQTIILREEEFKVLSKLDGKRVRKLRYLYPLEGKTAEIDVFQDELLGLVIIDVEFEGVDEKDSFSAPDFFGAEITQEEFTAGGMLCGKKYDDIKPILDKYGYNRII
jgi:adenylate cyclase